MIRRVLGIDCGTATTGWAVLDKLGNKYTHVSSGAIITSSKDDMILRLMQINESLLKIIKKFQPQEMAVEELFYFKNQKTVISVSQARGVILLVGGMCNLKIFGYTPLEVKNAVTGYGRAEKKQISFMVSKILGINDPPKLDDITDAMAIAICHLNTVNIKL